MRGRDRDLEDSPTRRAPRRSLPVPVLVLSALGPALAAAAWVPVRASLPDLDLALVIVVLVMAVGATRCRPCVMSASALAAIAFEFFDTRPFDQLAIARQPDVETTVVLAVVGALAGECVLRMRRQAETSTRRAIDLARIADTAGLVAAGGEVVEVVSRASAQLGEVLDLVDCRFEAIAPGPTERMVGRDGELPPPRPGTAHTSADRWEWASLPVWGQGEVIGRFVLHLRAGALPSPEQLRVAVMIADQVGAAFSAYSPPSPPPPGDDVVGAPALRLLR